MVRLVSPNGILGNIKLSRNVAERIATDDRLLDIRSASMAAYCTRSGQWGLHFSVSLIASTNSRKQSTGRARRAACSCWLRRCPTWPSPGPGCGRQTCRVALVIGSARCLLRNTVKPVVRRFYQADHCAASGQARGRKERRPGLHPAAKLVPCRLASLLRARERHGCRAPGTIVSSADKC